MTNVCSLNDLLLNNQWVNKEIQEEIKKYLEVNENEKKNNVPKLMGCNKSTSKGEVCNNIVLSQETRNISNKQFYLTPKGTGKRRTNKVQS